MTGLRDYYEPDCDVIDLSSTLKEGEEKIIDIVNLKRTKPLKIIGKIILEDRAKLTIVEVDFAKFDVDFLLDVECIGYKSEFWYHLSSLNRDDEKKIYKANVVHKGKESFSRASMFGVCEGSSQMQFLGSSDIRKGAAKTNTRQEAKIVNLSGKARCVASPALLISEEDVFASHGASMGSVPDNDIFYLMSRGIDRPTANKLIMVGYLKPIALKIKDEKIKEEALDLLGKEI